MRARTVAIMFFGILLSSVALGAARPSPYKPTAAELSQIRVKTAELASAVKKLAARDVDDSLLADVEVYGKAAVWILRYADEEFFSKRYVADTLAALDRGLARAHELAAGRPSWPSKKGQLVRAYRSRVDGSVQPYGLTIPASYDGVKPMRLDVVLHGRGASLNEVSFLAAHDGAKPPATEPEYLRLDVFGRGNNAYRWAGETDVFEAVASVRTHYRVDARQIVLRGFSMGGAGAWHLGLHYPDQWAAVEAGAGFTESKHYARLQGLPPYQEAALHIYDAADYALNACNLPIVGYGGENDPQLEGATNIRDQLEREGFHFRADGLNWLATDMTAIFLVGPKTGHKFHPDSKQQSDEFIEAALNRGRAQPSRVRFVTYTTRYSRCFWLQVAAMERHYQRADVDARRDLDGKKVEISARNVASLRLDLPGPSEPWTLTINGKEVAAPPATDSEATLVAVDKGPTGWTAQRQARAAWSPLPLRKTPGRQGPIDDAFGAPFLCVRPTGVPNHKLPQEYALATLERFAREFAKWMRGNVRVKDDAQVTPEDIAHHHLILFGDPRSNKLLKSMAEQLPIRWTKESIAVGAKKFAAANHTLTMIYPNPLNPARYVVLNSGHTFHEKDFRGTNALLFPRLGDYAVLRLPQAAAEPTPTPETAGWFDEHWGLPATEE